MAALINKSKKVIYKGTWELIKKSKPRPQIETVFSRKAEYEPGFFEFVKICKEPAYIEPKWGYIITKKGVIIENSLPRGAASTLISWRFGLPSPLEGFKAPKEQYPKIVKYPKVISLRYLWEWNYYHFFFDVLGKLSLIDSLNIDPSIPIVLGRYAMELPFVKEIINSGEFKNRNWIIQDNSYVLADEIIYCCQKVGHKFIADYLLQRLDLPGDQHAFNEKIFLTRGTSATRRILNNDEVMTVLRDYGFKVVDTSKLPVSEQMKIFNKTRYLVGIHGAGLTNIIFRQDAPLSVLELRCEGYISPDFKAICRVQGYDWDDLAGEPEFKSSQNSNFYISPELLAEKLKKMLNVSSLSRV